MNEIIKITRTQINGADVNSVSAREFYIFLGLGKSQFSRWVNKNIVLNEYAIENIDFIGFDILVEGNNIKDYALDIDFAYKLAMKSKGKKAEDIRNMFIRLKNEKNKPLSFEEMAKQTILLADKKIKELTQTIKNKDEVILAVADLNIKAGNVSFADFSKNLALENMGRNNVIKFCKARGYLRDNTEPYQPYVNRGYFVCKPSKEKINGEVRYTTFLTPRGTVWLSKIIKAEFEIDDERVGA